MRVNGNLVLNDNGSGELRHVYIERLDSTQETAQAAILTGANKGRLIFNVTTNLYKFWDGTAFQALGAGAGGGDTQTELDALESALGSMINTDGTFNADSLTAFTHIDTTGATNVYEILTSINTAFGALGTIAIENVGNVYIRLPAEKDVLVYDGFGTWVGRQFTFADISDVTATATEVNYVSGVTSSVQTQLDTLTSDVAAKQDTITGAATTIVDADLTASRVVVSTAGGKVGVGAASSVEVDYLVGVTSSVQTQLDGKADDLGYVPVNKAGDSLTGNLTFGGTATVKNLLAPADANDAVRKIDLDNAVAGIARDYQADVLGLETDFVDQPGRYIYVAGAQFTDTLTLTPAAGDIVVVDATGDVTEIAFDASVEGPGTLAWNANALVWLQWNGTAWSSFGGLDGVNAGVGLAKDGNTINVLLGAGIADLPTGEVGIELKTNGGLALVDPTTGLDSVLTDSVLTAKVTGALEIVAGGIQVKSAGIGATELSAAVAGDGLQGGAGSALSVEADTGISVSATGVAFDTTYGDARYLTLTGGTLTGPLTLAGDAATDLVAVPKQQLDAAVADVESDIAAIVTSLNNTYHVHSYTTTGATAAITVTHNLGVKYCNVTVVDDEDEVFIPQSIKFVDTNTLEVTLNTDITGKVVVTGHATLTL